MSTSTTFSSFDHYKLTTTFGEGYCEHNIVPTTDSDLSVEPQQQSIGKWARDKGLGSGAFGSVWLERKEGDGTFRAVKQVPKSSTWNKRELLALTKLGEYPQYFVEFFGWFEDKQNLYFAMKYYEYGDLASFIRGDSNIAEGDVKTITIQLLEGLKIMHKDNFCHRDLKPQNILIACLSPIVVKISDFGVSKQAGEGTKLVTTVGTPGYTAPEILGFTSAKSSAYTGAIDIWSLGCLIHALITGEPPFADQKLLDYVQGRCPFPTAKMIKNGVDQAAMDFIANLMWALPEDRITAEEALKEPWLAVAAEREGEETIWTKISDNIRVKDSGLGDSELGQDQTASYGSATELPLHDCITPYCAIKHRNVSALRRLCRVARMKVNGPQKGGTTLLHMVVDTGDEEMMKLLLEKGADITARDADENTALHLVVKMGHGGMAKLLLEKGADIKAQNQAGLTALLLAVKYHHAVMIKTLVENGADVMEKDEKGCTALHSATMEGHEKVARLLLENGADVMEKDGSGYTALHQAVSQGHEDLVRLLLEKGADVTEKDENGSTSLYRAVSGGHEQVARLLLEKGADTTGDESGYIALHQAASQGHEDLVRLLLDNGADVMEKHKNGDTALHRAARGGHEKVVRLLLENGADVMEKGMNEDTALHQAAIGGHEKVARLLLENGADVMGKGQYEWTALHSAATGGHETVVRLLMENGADVMARSILGNTSLHIAVYWGRGRVAQLLIATNRRLLSTANFEGKTALDIAIKDKKTLLIRLLKKEGGVETSKFRAFFSRKK